MRLRRALDEFVVDGIETTMPLFRDLVDDPDIADGRLRHPLAGEEAGADQVEPIGHDRSRRHPPRDHAAGAAEGLCRRHLSDGRIRPTIPSLYWIEPEAARHHPARRASTFRGGSRGRSRQDAFEIRIDTDFDAVIDGLRRGRRRGRPKTWINAPHPPPLRRALRASAMPHGRGLAGRDAGRRPLRRPPRRGVLRREHVLARARRLEGRARPSGRAAAGRRLHAARHAVHDRSI